MDSERLATNLRYLLWRRGVPRGSWAAELRRVLPGEWSQERVRRVLSRGTQDYGEVQALATALDLRDEDLMMADLLAEGRTDVLQENLRYLFAALEHGGKAELAAYLGKDPSTLSRWLAGTYGPPGTTLAQIAQFFGLEAGTDLSVIPVFLAPDPVSVQDRRRWLQERVDALSAEEIRDLFPALKRLLEER